jgi:hypothetical protein
VETWPREVCLDPRLLYNFTAPRFGVELSRSPRPMKTAIFRGVSAGY